SCNFSGRGGARTALTWRGCVPSGWKPAMNPPMYRSMSTALQPFDAVVFDVADELGYAMTEAVHLGMVGSSHEASNQMLVEAYGATFPYALFDEKCRLGMQERMSE